MSQLLEVIKNRFLSVVLFTTAPFYFFPPKAFLNRIFGSNYEIAYYHFRQNHRNAVNLALHFVCFWMQIIGNFCLLAELDRRYVPQRIPGQDRFLSLVSAAVWSLTQFTSGAPIIASVLSTGSIVSAYLAAPFVTPALMDAGCFGSFLLMLVLSQMATGGKIVTSQHMIRTFAGLPLLLGAFQLAEKYYFKVKAERAEEIRLVMLGYLIALPLLLRNPLRPLVYTGVVLLRGAYIATGDSLFFYLGYGFLASAFQGITHIISREEATLIALERKGDTAKIQFEYGHVTFFPNLAINSILDTVHGVPLPPRPSTEKDDEKSG